MGTRYDRTMNVTLTLDDKLVREVRKIAAERETTLTGLVRGYLQDLANQEARAGRVRRDQERLRETFNRLARPLDYGSRTWKREDLYVRGSK